MVSKVGWIIAAVIFLIFYYFVLRFIITQTTTYGTIAEVSALRSLVQNIWIALFSSPGIPPNWEKLGMAILPGLRTNLYRVALVVNETSGTDRGMVTLNITLSLDKTCEKKAWNSTVRVYEGNVELNSSLYNQTFCTESYLNSTEIVFKANFSAYQQKTFFIYFSAEKDVLPPSYSIPYNTSANFSYKLFPEETIPMLSLSKLKTLRNMSYEEIKTLLAAPKEIYIEISG